MSAMAWPGGGSGFKFKPLTCSITEPFAGLPFTENNVADNHRLTKGRRGRGGRRTGLFCQQRIIEDIAYILRVVFRFDDQ